MDDTLKLLIESLRKEADKNSPYNNFQQNEGNDTVVRIFRGLANVLEAVNLG